MSDEANIPQDADHCPEKVQAESRWLTHCPEQADEGREGSEDPEDRTVMVVKGKTGVGDVSRHEAVFNEWAIVGRPL